MAQVNTVTYDPATGQMTSTPGQGTVSPVDVQKVYEAIRAADKAGDTEGVKRLAEYLKSIQGQATPQPAPQPAAPPRTWADTGHDLYNATVNTLAGVGQGIAAIPDAVTHAISGGLYYGVEGAGQLASGLTGDQSYAQAADRYAKPFLNPVTIGGAIENAAPTPQSTSGGVARFGAQLLGGALPGSGANTIQNVAERAMGIRPMAPGVNSLSPAQPTTLGRVANAFMPGRVNTSGARLVGQKLAEDNVHPFEAAQELQAAAKNGQPMMLADMGDNTRALAADVARQPGAARDIGLNAVRDRQIGDNPFGTNTVPSQSQRVQTAISRDLGPVTDPIAASQALDQQARAAAAPLYEKAYSNGGSPVFHTQIEDLLQRPSMQKALANARNIAAEEGRNPDTLGLVLGKDNMLVKVDKPTWQTFDYIKRGLDDVVESYRDPVTGKLNLDTQGRAVNNTLRDFLSRMDEVNPDYAAARAAYAGPASMKEALNTGSEALNWPANQIRARIANMSQAEKDQFWLGMRSALAQKAAATNDGVNVVRTLVGSGAKRDALAEAAGGKANIENFMRTLEREQQMNATYGKVTGGSPTAANLIENANNNVAVNAVGHFGQGGGWKDFLLNHTVRGAQDALRYGIGQAGKRTREDAAALLFTANPNDFTKAMSQANSATLRANQAGTNALLGVTPGVTAAAQTNIQASATTR